MSQREDLRNHSVFKILSGVVLFFFAWTFGGLFDVAYAVNSAAERRAINPSGQRPIESAKDTKTAIQRPDEKLQKTLDEISNIIKDPSKDINQKKGFLRAKASEIRALDAGIRAEFKKTEMSLRAKKLPSVVLQRHQKFVKNYEGNLRQLTANLNAIDRARTKPQLEGALKKALAHLDKVKPPKRHRPLDPNKLPHRTAEPVWKKPRLTKVEATLREDSLREEFERDLRAERKPILVASAGSLAGILSSAVVQATPPSQEDLSETMEVKFTPEIRARAAELNYNPLRLYEYVRNNFKYELYYGSLKGAQQTLIEQSGNDFDQASLLIAFLRASNIPARYVYGTIDLPIEDVKRWIGIDDAEMVLTAFAAAGIPAVAITEGGVISAIRFEHIWCQAFVFFTESRGALEGTGDTWVDLDPSFKDSRKEIAKSIEISVFDELQYLSGINQNDPVAAYETSLQTYIGTVLPDSITGAIKVRKEIEQQWFEYLMGTLPYDVIVSVISSDISNSYRHSIDFVFGVEELVETPLTYSISTAEIAGKRISLSYSPATSSDGNLIESYGGLYNVPAYLLQLRPELRIDGEIKATGDSIGFGKSQSFSIIFNMPYGKTDIVDNEVIAGEYIVPVINLYRTPEHQVLVRTDNFKKLNEILQSGGQVSLDDYAGEILHLTGAAYFQRLDAVKGNAEQILQVVDINETSAAIISIDVAVSYIFGIPYKVSLFGLSIDVDRNVHSPIPMDGNLDKKKEFMILSGMTASFFESKNFEDIYGVESVSAVKIIQIANEKGIPVYTLNGSNITSYINVLQVSDEVKADIINAVNAGNEVMIPERELKINDWYGIGYIITNPQTGASAYMISGGLAGGSTTLTSFGVTIAQILARHLAVVAVAETIENTLSPNTVTFPGEDNIDGTKDDKTYPIIDLLRLPEAERDNYYDPHPDVGYSGVIKVDESNVMDYLSYFVTLKAFQSRDTKPYLRVTPSIVWAIEHIAYVTDAVREGDKEDSLNPRDVPPEKCATCN